MADIQKGYTFANGETVTPVKLHALVDDATVADESITTAKLANSLVTTVKIADANVTTAKIADANITTVKIADANVTTAKIADANVTTAKIADSAVTSAKIADGTIVNADINASAAIAGTKITPNFGSQNVVTTGISTAASFKITGTKTTALINYLGTQTIVTPDDGDWKTSIRITSDSDAIPNSIGFWTNNGHRAVIDASGNVGVNGTVTANNFVGPGSVPPGAIMPFAMNGAPAGWLAANGDAVSRSTYANLFASIGTGYGVGNGSTTFNLPDLRGYFIRSAGTNSDGTASGTFGTKQADAYKSHNHGGTTGTGTTGNESQGHTHSGTTGNESQGHTHSGTTGNESQDHTHSGTTGGESVDHAHYVSGTTGGQTADHSHQYGLDNINVGGYENGGVSRLDEISTAWTGGTSNDHAHNFAAWTGGRNTGHTHNFTTGGISGNHTHSFTTGGISGNHTHSFTTGNISANHTHGVPSLSISADGGTETRPKNIALLYCIKF